MPRGRKILRNSIAPGAIGALTGSVIGAATGVLISDKKTRNRIASGLEDVKEYAKEAFDSVNTMTGQKNKRFATVGIKGGASKLGSGAVRRINHLKKGYADKSKRRS